ncbi:conserved hypothetical protein [Candidatus Sulfopaludibacter sp. SbA4]|nr:conserved hypothetical protein [Candidatus Sulfopaludibacter sp. SbA4]
MSWRIFEYLERGDQSTIGVWLVEKDITERDRGQLVQKMDLLAMHGPNLPPGLLAGPIKSKRNRKMQSHIYKLIIHGDKMLRPMLCKGPIEMESEYTMLIGAIEVNFKLDVDAEDAEIRRAEIIENPNRRRINGRYK